MYLGPLNSGYPPPPYPRKPRYRVDDLSGWREATDLDLINAGDNPADYMPMRQQPASPPKPILASTWFLISAIFFLLAGFIPLARHSTLQAGISFGLSALSAMLGQIATEIEKHKHAEKPIVLRYKPTGKLIVFPAHYEYEAVEQLITALKEIPAIPFEHPDFERLSG